MNELVDIVRAFAAKKSEVGDQRELYADIAERIIKATSSMFGVKTDEVAILILTTDLKHLRFIAPRPFIDIGTIPLTKKDSIAIGVLVRKTGEANNNVPQVRHVAFYESVKIRDRAVPIQKMITVPIMYKDSAIGVAQISRKGDTPGQAGADFSSADVAKAQAFYAELAPYLWQARPDTF